jgi:hypothetical protein
MGLLFSYYTLFGAEFTKVYDSVHGEKIIPNSYSVRIHKETILSHVTKSLRGKLNPTITKNSNES